MGHMIVAAAGMGFLLAVLWFDLMFDVQVWPYRHDAATIPDAVVDSIATYYRRVTTEAHPMSRLVALAMLVTLASLIAAGVRDGGWAPWIALALVVPPIAYAGASIVPAAVRLGSRRDDLPTQQRLARAILLGHLACWCSVFAALLVTLIGA